MSEKGSHTAISGGGESVFNRSPAYQYRILVFYDRVKAFMYDTTIGGDEKWFLNYS